MGHNERRTTCKQIEKVLLNRKSILSHEILITHSLHPFGKHVQDTIHQHYRTMCAQG